MRESLRCLPIVASLLIYIGVFGSKPEHDVASLLIPVKIRVNNSSFMLLVSRIESFKNVFANELIISIEIEYYRVWAAVVMSSNVDVFESRLSLLVLQVGVTIIADIIEIKVFPVDFVTVVGGGVVDYYNEVVAVVLLKDGVQVVLYPKLGVVVVTRDYDAHGQFVGVFSKIPNSVDFIPFFCLNPNLLFVTTRVYFVIETS